MQVKKEKEQELKETVEAIVKSTLQQQAKEHDNN